MKKYNCKRSFIEYYRRWCSINLRILLFGEQLFDNCLSKVK